MLGMVFVLPIGFAMQPVIARLYEGRHMKRLEDVYTVSTKWATVAGVPAMIFLALYASDILTALYGRSYTRGAEVLAILALAQLVNTASGPCGQVVSMVGRSDLVFANSLVALTLNVVLNVLLIPHYGMIGAAIAWAAAIVLVNLMRLYQVWRVLHVHPFHGWPTRVSVALGVFTAAALAAHVGLDQRGPLGDVLMGAVVGTVAYVASSTYSESLRSARPAGCCDRSGRRIRRVWGVLAAGH